MKIKMKSITIFAAFCIMMWTNPAYANNINVTDKYESQSTMLSPYFRMAENSDNIRIVDTYTENSIEYSLIEYTLTEEQQWYVTRLPNNETIIIKNNIKGRPVVGIFNTNIAELYFVGPKKISLPDTIIKIEDGAFYNFITLENINIPNNVNYIGESAFGKCYSLKNITLPNGLTKISDMMFEGSDIKSITIPNSVNQIGYRAFAGCEKLRNITLHNGILSIGEEAFDGCIRLSSITLPNNTDLSRLFSRTFNNCVALENVEIPYYIEKIGQSCFPKTTNLIFHNKKPAEKIIKKNKKAKKKSSMAQAIEFVKLSAKEEQQYEKEISETKNEAKKIAKQDVGKTFETGNHFAEYGEQLMLQTLSQEIKILTKNKIKDNQIIAFKEQLDKNEENPIQWMIDIADKADIWYCKGLSSDIHNQYSKISAFSIFVGKCADAQANANELLLKDIAKLTGAKLPMSKTIGDVTYSDKDLAAFAEATAKLDDKLKIRIRTNRLLNKLINDAITYCTEYGTKLAELIAKDTAYINELKLSAFTSVSSEIESLIQSKGLRGTDKLLQVLNSSVSKINKYGINTYGPTKRIQNLGKKADQYSNVNFKYGKKLIDDAKKKLDSQQKLLDIILVN